MFLKIYSGRVANANKTLKKQININKLIERINDPFLRDRIRMFEKFIEVNLWDLGKKATEEINTGDYLAVSCEDYIYTGKIIGIIHDDKGEIGDIVGWARQFEQPWQNVIFLENVRVIPQDEKIHNFIQEINRNQYRIFNKFLKIGIEEEKHFNKIISSYHFEDTAGRQTEFVSHLPKWIDELIDDISRLKNQTIHQERSHESLIERFFENSGYNRFDDIQFRIGRIDISISIDKRPVIVVEVKRYWNLNAMDDQNVIQQAYNYALQNGARFVIISNGDYYAIFDRDKGRTYQENLFGEFTLTSIHKSDLDLVNFLRKDNLVNYY